MKKILFSFLFFLSVLSVNQSFSQTAGSFTITPKNQCFIPSTPVSITQGSILIANPAVTSITWSITTSPSATCTASLVPATTGTPSGSSFTVTMPCCGSFSITGEGFVNGVSVGTFSEAFVPASPTSTILVGNVFCPNGGVITPSSQAICIGSQATLTASGAATYTWNDPAQTVGAQLVVSPSVNTCYTYTGTTVEGCTITPAAAACVSVQSASLSVTPASQTMCLGSPVSFTATGTAINNASLAPGTVVNGYQWFDPGAPPTQFATTQTATNAAQAGTYSVIMTHTGAAGTCTLAATSLVTPTTSIPVTLTPVSQSVCPNGSNTLTANSIQTTVATNFTWTTIENGGPPVIETFNGNPFVFNNISPLATVTVDVDYFGCPGQATTTIGLLTLTPTLTSSSPSTCPSQSLTLTASGAINYTFTGNPTSPVGTITLTNISANTATHLPTGGNLPMQYCVSTESLGCVGSTCIVVGTKVLTPILTASSPSVCPGTQFTLTPSGSGVHAGANYTFSSAYNPNLGNTSPHVELPPVSATLAETYWVTVDSLGCTGTASVTVFELTLTPTLTSSSPSICAGSTVDLGATGGASTQYTFMASEPGFDPTPATTTMIATLGNSFTIHNPPSTMTTVFYTVEVDSAGCTGSGTYSIGVLDLGPTLTLTPATPSICPGTAITFSTGGALNYTLTAPSGSVVGSGAGPSYTVTDNTSPNVIPPLAGVIYTLSGDSLGCVGSTTVAVFEFKLKPQLVPSSTLVCSGQPVALTATNITNSPLTTQYTFIELGVPPSTVLASSAFSVQVNPTVQTVYAILADSAFCTSTLPPYTVTVQIKPNIALLPSSSSASVCPGMSATLSVATPTSATSYTYNWSQVNGTTSTITPSAGSQTVITYPITNSTYSLHVLDDEGCVGDTIINIGIDPSISFPFTLASSGSTICVPQTVTLSASSSISQNNGSFGPISYTWTPNFSITPTSGSTVVAGPNITTVYTVIANNGYGCVAQRTINVAVGTIPQPSIVASSNGVCVGFTSTLTAFGANSYTWTGTTFTNAIAQQSVSVIDGNYTVLASNGGGCTNTAVKTITLLPNLIINLTQSSPTTCITSNSPKFSKPVKLSASGAGSYVWFPYNPLQMTYSLGPTTDVRPPTTTNYTVIGSTANCSGTAQITVTVIPQFTINVTPPLPAMCIGDSIKLSVVNIGPGAAPPASALTYSWTEALNAPPISMSGYFTNTVMVFPQNTTTYTTEVRDSRECVSLPRLVTVTVLPKPLTSVAIPTINGVQTNTVCFVGLNPGAADVTINLVANNNNTGLQFGVVPTYTWVSPYEPEHISILTPPNSNAVIVNAPIRTLNNSAVAVYTVISGYNGIAGCKRMDTISVRAIDCRPIRAVKWTTAELLDTICARNCITFINQTDTMAGGPQTYTWTFRGGSPATSNEANPTVCYNFPSSRAYDVILQVANPYPRINPTGGAPGSTLAIGLLGYVKVVDYPNVTIVSPGQVRSDTTVRFGQSVNLNGSGALTYEWYPGYNISSLSKPDVTVNPFKTTQYILTGYNSKNCFSSDTINVIVVEDCGEMYVPNAFTPNNDGTNDVLYVRGICLQSLTFMVFNRWGEKVFETADQKVGWDGTYKGQELNTGVFVYRLEGKTYDGKAFSSKGNITLIR